MASIRERAAKNGKVTYAVLYNHGGKQRSKTFDDPKSAGKFRALVDALGPEAALEVGNASQKSGGRTLDGLAVEWLAYKKRDMTVEGHRDYERQYAKWIKPTFG